MQRARDFNLTGSVESVETYLTKTSTKSYRLLADGKRELLNDYSNPTTATPSSPVLWELLRFDVEGKLVEDISIERQDDQEPYRRSYSYDEVGRVIETASYAEDGSLVMKGRYVYGPGGGKIAEESWSPDGWMWSRSEFDEHENLIRNAWYRSDGTLERDERPRYEYSSVGNISEQLYFPPERPEAEQMAGLYAPFRVDGEANSAPTPIRYRTVVVRHDDGRVLEEHSYWPDGSLKEKKTYDESGVMQQRDSSMGASDSETTIFDQFGREVEIRQVAPAGLFSSRDVNDVTTFAYDERGNLVEMTTRGPDGAILRRTTNSYSYDNHRNWIGRTETTLSQDWQSRPFLASFESIREYSRTLRYFTD